MAKSDFPPLRMRVERGRLVPAGPFDQERLDSYRNGSIVMCRFTEERDRVLVKKWFAIIGLVLKTCETPWKNKDEAHEAIKLALGIVNLSKTVSGNFMQYPKSLTDLEDPEMTEALESMTELLSRMTGVDVETLRKETAHIAEAEHHDTQTGEIIEHEPFESGSAPEPAADDRPPSVSAAPDDVPPLASSGDPSPTDLEWLRNVSRMLWAAANYKGDMAVLKAQKVAAMASYPKPDGCSQIVTGKAEAAYGYCRQIVLGELEKADGLAMVAGVVGCDQHEIGVAA